MDGVARQQVIDEGHARLEQLVRRCALEAEGIADEVEAVTGERIGPPSSGQANILDAPWGRLLAYRQECLFLLEAIGLLEPLMAGVSGRTVSAALKTADAVVNARVLEALEGAGLVVVERSAAPE